MERRGGQPVPLSTLDESRISRLSTTFSLLQRVESPGMASLMKTGCPSGAIAGGCEPGETPVVYELRCNHPEFYRLLKVNNLLPLLLYEDVFVVVPDRVTLAELPQVRDDATADALRYHLVKNNGTVFQKVTGVMQYDTLSGDKKVQVEELSNSTHTINGKALRSDENNIEGVFHIRNGLLRPDDVMPIEQPASPDGLGDTGGGGGAESDDDGATGTTTETTTETLMSTTRMHMNKVNDFHTFSNKSLNTAVKAMNSPAYYSAPISMPSSVDTKVLNKCQTVEMRLAVYNTDRLFDDYKKNGMNDVARVTASRLLKLTFPATELSQTHVNHGNSTYTEYAVRAPSDISRASKPFTQQSLACGLVGLSFTSPYLGPAGGHTVALCRLTQSPLDSSVYMSEDEKLMLRFSGDMLHTISIDHRALAADTNTTTAPSTTGSCCTGCAMTTGSCQQGVGGPLQKEHFLELQMARHASEFSVVNKQQLGREDFDDLLLTHASLKKLVKKAKRQVGKAASKAKRLSGKLTGSALIAADASVLLTSKFNDAVDAIDGDGTQETAKVLSYDKSHRVRASSASSQLVLKKYDVTVGKEAILVYLPENPSSNKLASDWGTAGLVKSVDFSLSDRAKLSLNVSKLGSDKSSHVYYVTSGRDILVFRFDSSSNLVALYSISKTYDLARRLIQSRNK
jgi:hypothetical protein